VVLAGCLLLSGQLPLLTAAPPTTFPHEGLVQCLANFGLHRWPLSCPDIALPTGTQLVQGLPILLVGWALTLLPGISAHVAVEISDVLVVALALEGARRLLRRFGLGDAVSLGAAALYVVSPSVLALTQFSGTYWGMLLLPGILELHAILLDHWREGRLRTRSGLVVLCFLLQLGVLLLDGYTFVLMLVAALLLLPAAIRGMSMRSVTSACTAYLTCTVAAYAVYQAYVPGGNYVRSSIDLVRAMGLDVVTLIRPTYLQWWTSFTGHALNPAALWGDATNSAGNYLGFLCLGLAVFALLRHRRRQRRLVRGLLGCFVVGLLMALGPSLKIDDIRPPLTGNATYATYLMPRSAATATLPTSVLHDKVPGVNQMRAAYRWFLLSRWALIALGAVGLQSLVSSSRERPGLTRRVAPAVIGVLAVAELMPNPVQLVSAYRANDRERQAVSSIAADVRRALPAGSMVVFAPGAGIQDDTLGSFIAPAARLRTYDASDDKTLARSQPHWPVDVQRLLAGRDPVQSLSVVLRRHEADAVVIPRFDPRWSVYFWPPARAYQQRGDDFARQVAANGLRVVRHRYFYVATLP
jgi:hypothetical protein